MNEWEKFVSFFGEEKAGRRNEEKPLEMYDMNRIMHSTLGKISTGEQETYAEKLDKGLVIGLNTKGKQILKFRTLSTDWKIRNVEGAKIYERRKRRKKEDGT